MKRRSDNQINTSFIDILRIKWQVFFIAVIFLPHQLDRWQAPKQWLIIDQRPVEQRAFQRDQRPRDNGYKSIFTNSWLVHQRHRSWIKGIRQKSTKRVNSFIACSAFCPGPPNRDTRDSEKWWRVYTSITTMARHVWCVYKSSGKTHKNRNACIDAHRSAVPTKMCGFTRHPTRTGKYLITILQHDYPKADLMLGW